MSEVHPGKVFLYLFIFTAVFVSWCFAAAQEEKTYSIALTKSAEVGEDIQEIEGKRVLSETHVVQKGEHVWNMLRERGLLDRRNLPEILDVLKHLNRSFANLDLIHPGQKIVIPLKIVPVSGPMLPRDAPRESDAGLEALREEDLQYYTVKPGDSVVKVVIDLYDVPPGHLYGDYLALVRQLNPTIKDLNAVYPGQRVRLPVYSPQIIRRPATSPQSVRAGEAKTEGPGSPLAQALSEIFGELGEEWVQSGQQFIPLRSGGQVDLKAESYPSINLRNGRKVIVDLHHGLPEKMRHLIESTWDFYRVVPILREEGLAEALRKILDLCGYVRVLNRGDEALEFQSEISIRVSGDWVVVFTENSSDPMPHAAVINLETDPGMRTPKRIRDYLALHGLKVIEHPKMPFSPDPPAEGDFVLDRPENPKALIRTLLDLTGRTYSGDLEIPVYQSRKADAKLAIRADFFLRVGGQDAIIDLSGLDAEMASFLEEHAFRLLSIRGDATPLDTVAQCLQFLGVAFTPGPQFFSVSPRDASRNIRISFQGVLFSDRLGRPVLTTPVQLPEEIASFLGGAGYGILSLPNP